MVDTAPPVTGAETVLAGRIGLVTTLGVAVILAIHPLGSSDLYDDGGRFLDHVGWYWVVLHLAATVLLLTWPAVIGAWAKALSTVEARFIGRMAAVAATAGMGVGALHLIATDTMTFVAFSDTYEAGAGSEATEVGADLLLRLHAATLTAWVTSFWFAVPLLVGVAALRDPRLPKWIGGTGLVAAGLQVVALLVTIAEEQWTTVSEMGFFRIGATLLILWMVTVSHFMRRGDLAPGVPIQSRV